MRKTIPVLLVLLLVSQVEARYCNNRNCRMCNRLFGPMPGFEPAIGPQIDSTPHEVVKVMVAALKLKPKDLMYDLGCGDGRALIEAVRQSGCRASGVEILPRVAAIAKDNVRRSGFENRIVVTNANALRYNDLAACTAIFMYLNPPLIQAILPRLNPTTRVVSYMHPLPGVPCKIIRAPNGAPIYVSIQPGDPVQTNSWKW